MFYRFSDVFTAIVLILILSSSRTRGTPSPEFLVNSWQDCTKKDCEPDDQPTDTSSSTPTTQDEPERIWRCGLHKPFMNIEISNEELREDMSKGWNYYSTVGRQARWRKFHLTYSVHNYAGYPVEKVQNCIARATKKWTDVATGLSFEKLGDNKEADVKIQFVEHLQNIPGATAHSFYPNSWRRLMEFGLGRHWTVDRNFGINACCVCTHEFGHVLGLHHSQNRSAIMYGASPCFYAKFGLHQDDKDGILSLYNDLPPKKPEDRLKNAKAIEPAPGDLPDRPAGPRPTGPRPTGPRPTGNRPTGPRPTGPSPTGPRPTGPRPTGPRPTGPSPTGPSPTSDSDGGPGESGSGRGESGGGRGESGGGRGGFGGGRGGFGGVPGGFGGGRGGFGGGRGGFGGVPGGFGGGRGGFGGGPGRFGGGRSGFGGGRGVFGGGYGGFQCRNEGEGGQGGFTFNPGLNSWAYIE